MTMKIQALPKESISNHMEKDKIIHIIVKIALLPFNLAKLIAHPKRKCKVLYRNKEVLKIVPQKNTKKLI
jgi:hypothetical protein